MKMLIKILIAVITAIILSGCSATKEITEIKPVIIHPAVIQDTLIAVQTDTVIVGVDVIKNDTITVVKYFPKLEKFYIKVKPDSIIVMDTLRTVQTIEKIVQTPWLAKAGLVLIGALIAIAGYFFYNR